MGKSIVMLSATKHLGPGSEILRFAQDDTSEGSQSIVMLSATKHLDPGSEILRSAQDHKRE